MIFVMSKWDLRYNSHFWYSMRKRGKTCYDFEPMTTITNCHEKHGVHLKSMGMNKVGGWVMWQTGANWGYLSRSPCPPPSPPPAEASVSHWLSANHQPDITIRPNRVSKKTAQWFSMWLCIYVIWERKKIKINEGRYQNLHPLSTRAI